MKKTKSKAGAKKKPVQEKKQRVVLFVEKHKIDAKGGESKYKEFLYGAEEEIKSLNFQLEEQIQNS